LFPDEARARLGALGFRPADVEVLAAHFLDAEARGRLGHGVRRIEWLETWEALSPEARPERIVAEAGYERWDGNGALGYLVLNAVVEAQLADPPGHARLVVAGRTFPTGVLGHWTRRLAEGGLVAVLTATSPRRLGHPDGGPRLTGTNPLSIAIPSSHEAPLVADVSMGNLTYGDVLAGNASEDELAPFGGEHAHKAFALAVGLQLLVDALVPAPAPAKPAPSLHDGSVEPAPADDGFGAVLLVARPESDPMPAFRALAHGVRLPGDR
jgi:LDH2 family malate/lactate/ureidoglycolate dehydrogenase